MAKPLKSQWEFGELFPEPGASRRVFAVSELTTTIKRTLENQVGRIWVTGEVTNCRLQSSGHAYFALKDAGAQLSCVLFRDEARGFQRTALVDGQSVILQGDLTVYEARGQYQLRVLRVELQGVGALQIAFERLKQRLQAEGLFAAERKRPIPRWPEQIGVVTSATGAALQDLLHVIRRRHPGLRVVLANCRVQGQGAAAEIAAAIGRLNAWNQARAPHQPPRLDLILVTRGGGSLEDLWAFNEEEVARAIHASALPVLSAVGHEIDFTIADFVADARAATPSAAGELITEGAVWARQLLARAMEQMRRQLERCFALHATALDQLQRRSARVHPRRRLEAYAQRLDDLREELTRTARRALRARQQRWEQAVHRLERVQPRRRLAQQNAQWQNHWRMLLERVRRRLEEYRAQVREADARLRLLGPSNVLQRGYSITRDAASGTVVRDAASLRPGQTLVTQLDRGEVRSRVEPPNP